MEKFRFILFEFLKLSVQISFPTESLPPGRVGWL